MNPEMLEQIIAARPGLKHIKVAEMVRSAKDIPNPVSDGCGVELFAFKGGMLMGTNCRNGMEGQTHFLSSPPYHVIASIPLDSLGVSSGQKIQAHIPEAAWDLMMNGAVAVFGEEIESVVAMVYPNAQISRSAGRFLLNGNSVGVLFQLA